MRNQPWTLLLPLLLGAACTPDPGPFALQAGLHRARIPAPLGIGTVGGRLADATANPSPYADVFPATNRLHGHPDIRVVALSRGEGFELVLVRLDLFAVTEDLRRAVVTALQLRTGRDLDDALILAATRSAAGPGRMGGVKDRFELGADSFLPGYQAALVGAVADAVQAALDDLQPARLGTGAATVEGAFADVRCEDGLDDTPTTVPLLAVERAGAVEALVMVAGLTGGVVPIGELTLSNDAAGAVEQAVEDRFDTPVMALLLQGASADSDPVDPEDRIGDDGGVQSNAFDELDGIGQVFADGVEPSLGALAWEDAPTLAARTRRVKVDREVLDYRTLDFPYEFGADQCLGGTGCTDPQTDPVLDNDCEAFPAEDPAPSVAELTVASAGAFTLATFPGELGAPFAAALAARAAEELGVDPLVLVGQAQGYMGSGLAETDWWLGGEEARGSFWGPRQGDFLGEALLACVAAHGGDADAVDWEEPPAVDLPELAAEALAPDGSTGGGAVYLDVDAEYGPTDRVSFTVTGGDPLLGAPLARLLDADGDRVLRPGGQPYDSDDQSFTVDLGMTPAWDAVPGPSVRTFYWTFTLLPRHKVAGVMDLPAGSYRFEVDVPLDGGNARTVESSLFTLLAD